MAQPRPIDKRRAADTVAREARHGAMLRDLGARLLDTTDEAAILDDAVRTAREMLAAHCVGIFLFDPKGNQLRLTAGAGWHPATVGTVAMTPSGESFAGATFVHGEIVQVENLTGEGRFLVPSHLVSHRIQAGIDVPLVVRGRPIGVLGTYYQAPHRFSDHERHVLTMVAQHTALALDKGRRHAERETRLRRQEEAQAGRPEVHKPNAASMLLAGMAHELNNPLSAIQLSVQLLKRQHTLPPAVQRCIDMVEEECSRAVRLVRELLVFARRPPPDRKPAEVAALVGAALEAQAPDFKLSGVRVVTELSPVPPLWVDAEQLHQVLVDLFANAEYAMTTAHGGGVLTIRARHGDGWAVLEIEDDGPGIAAEHVDDVFDPFFTTKAAGEGLGLGLTAARGIVEAHGGGLEVANLPGGGARFTLKLPLGEPAPEPVAAVAPGRHARILVVDDQAALRGIFTEVLAGLGHTVDEAGTGQECLQCLQQTRYDLITLDLKLPDMDGEAIWRWLRAHDPELADRVMFMTGDTTSLETQQFLQQAGRPVLTKPMAIDEIRRKVNALLSGAPGA